MSFIKYIADESHYKEVLSLVGKAKQTVWIGTADIKDLYVDDKPFLALIASLLKERRGGQADSCQGTRNGLAGGS
jgi:hypothetical protein